MSDLKPTAIDREQLAREIAGTTIDGVNDHPLEYVLRRGYAAMGLMPSFAAKMCLKLADCQIEDTRESVESGEGR